MKGPVVERSEPCRMCGSTRGSKIAEVHYWDLKESDLVACFECRLMQLDPMLTDEDTRLGCEAYYLREALHESRRERLRNCVRNLRRGIAFGSELKLCGIRPHRILELGPGNGYFAAGLKFIFPDSEITVLDVVEKVLSEIKRNHGFETILGVTDNPEMSQARQFDLVIARDIIEHVSDISVVIGKVHALLRKDGYFHFITPNGYEDAWAAYSRWRLTGQPAELLINHVNYFDGLGLERFLQTRGFRTVTLYTDTLKFTRRGRGWRLRERNASPISTGVSAKNTIDSWGDEIHAWLIDKDEVFSEWWLKPDMNWLAPLYCRFRQHRILRLPVGLDVGHEINGLMQKI